jgi:hypothetical protein
MEAQLLDSPIPNLTYIQLSVRKRFLSSEDIEQDFQLVFEPGKHR